MPDPRDPRFDRYYAVEWMGVPPDVAACPAGRALRSSWPRRKPWTYERPVYEHDRAQRLDGFGSPE